MKKKIIFDKIEFDSVEELEFYHWTLEAQQVGLIGKCAYKPNIFTLCESQCVVEDFVTRKLTRPITYQPDFVISIGKKVKDIYLIDKLFPEHGLYFQDGLAYIDV